MNKQENNLKASHFHKIISLYDLNVRYSNNCKRL